MAERDFRVWDEVPAGSFLVIRITQPGTFISRARVVRSLGGVPLEEDSVTHVQLSAGYRVEILAGVSYTVRLSVAFRTQSATTLEAEVREPGGARFKSPFSYRMVGAGGDTVRATIIATTEELDLEHGSGSAPARSPPAT